MKNILAMLAATGLLWGQSAAGQVLKDASDGRLLASGCFQCHGTDGRDGGFERIAGMEKKELIEELREMASEPPGKDIMHPHARGYTRYELELIADYFSRLPQR